MGAGARQRPCRFDCRQRIRRGGTWGAYHARSVLQTSALLRAGIMPITTYGGFRRMTGFCKTRIPADIDTALEAIKDNDEAVKVLLSTCSIPNSVLTCCTEPVPRHMFKICDAWRWL